MTTLRSLVSLVDGLVDKLLSPSWSPPTSSSPSSYTQIKEEVETLRRRMKRIQALLTDAEEREIREETIKLWLAELRELGYDAEDVVEEFEYELRLFQLACEEEEQDPTTHEERDAKRRRQVSDVTTPCSALNDASFQQQILAKIQGINRRFDEIYEDRRTLKLKKRDGERRVKQEEMQRPPTSSLLGNSPVYGRDADENKVVDMLVSWQIDGQVTENVSVVSIVGMGGLGKTTLAQLVYNDDRVKICFEPRSWVCVSDCFDVVKLTKDILETLPGGTGGLQGFNPLQEKLHENLKGKRFLLVLDDLWNENLGQWEALWRPLSSGAEGSRVLVTTRNEDVSRISGAIRSHSLKGLCGEDSWKLFVQCAFGGRNPGDHPKLVSVGKEIVQKCGGLPLAIKALGSLLFHRTDEDSWNDVLRSEIWELPPEGKNNILPALKLSYYHLPSPIRACFAFCAMFPKDHPLPRKEDLVRLWMAHGYINIKPGARKSVEDVGREYFDDLVQRSVFQLVGTETDPYEDPRFKMHDLIHDLAMSIWESECSTLSEDGMVSDGASSRKVRHLSLPSGADMGALWSRFQHLRTFYLFSWSIDFVLPGEVLDDMFRRMKYLRVLYLSGVDLSQLPDSVGNLKHLRYLAIQTLPESTRLPESLGNLLNLQTLRVDGYLEELPKRLTDLNKLRHLYLPYMPYMPYTWYMPQGIGRLTELQSLGQFVVGEGSCAAGIQELRHLNGLRGALSIEVRSLKNWVNTEPYILIKKKGLESLRLNLYHIEDRCDDESGLASMMQKQSEELMESVRPHTNIEGISVFDYIGDRLPKWMGDPSYSKLTRLYLKGCNKCTHLPQLGRLPSLQFLEVDEMYALVTLGQDFSGEGMVAGGASIFPSLEELILSNLPELEGSLCIGTEDGSAFPRLRHLTIEDGYKLGPVKVRHLTYLIQKALSYLKFLLPGLSVGYDSTSKKLRIQGYDGRTFPGWLSPHNFLSYLRILQITGCFNLTTFRLTYPTCPIDLTAIQFTDLPDSGDDHPLLGGGTVPSNPPSDSSSADDLPPSRAGMAPSSASSSFSSSLSLIPPPPTLQVLCIKDCPELVSLGGLHEVSSLRILSLVRCRKLDFSHKDRLPPRLGYANIRYCPLLSGWFHGDQTSQLRKLWVDDELAVSDRTSITESLDAMREIMGDDLEFLELPETGELSETETDEIELSETETEELSETED